jgi:hypothetical protein
LLLPEQELARAARLVAAARFAPAFRREREERYFSDQLASPERAVLFVLEELRVRKSTE